MGSTSHSKEYSRAEMQRAGNEAWSALEAGDFATAEAAYDTAIEMAESMQDSAALAVFLSYRGVSHREQGRVGKAKADFQRSSELASENGLYPVEAHARLLLGETARDHGQNREAIIHFLAALEAADGANDPIAMEVAFGNLGRLYLERGWAEQATEWFHHALNCEIEHTTKSSWLGSMGLAMAELGQYQDAIDYYIRAYEEARRDNNLQVQAVCLGNKGNAHYELGDYARAIECYQQALEMSEKLDDGRRIGIWFGNIGTTFLKQGSFEDALAYCQKAVEFARTHNDEQSEAAHLDSIGDCYLSANAPDAAIEKYREALELSKKIEDRQGERIYLSNIGKAHQQKGLLEVAYEYFYQAIELFDEQRSAIKADDLKTSFANRGQELYRDMVNICLSTARRVEAVEYVGRAKSRALLDLLSNSPIDISQLQGATEDGALSKLIQKESDLRGQIAHFERMFWQGPSPETGSRGGAVPIEDSQRIYSEWRDTVNQLRRRHPNYAALVSASTLKFAELKSMWTPSINEPSAAASLSPDTAILEFFWTDQYMMASAMWHDCPEPVVHVITDPEQLEALSTDVGTFLEMSATEGWEVPKGLTKRLYKKLLLPLISNMPQFITRLLLAPHSVLYQMPFAALHDGTGYLCQKYSISYIPTTSLIPVLANKKTRVQSEPTYLVSAISDYSATRNSGLTISARTRSAAGLDDLSYTLEEANTILNLGQRSRSTTRLLTNSEVKESLTDLFSKYSIVHFAGHAVFNADEPMASGLVLSDGTILSAAAILQGNALRTENGKLLVLSACQTGVNRVTAGGEILGLARALMYAGMPNLILSLWEVADRSTAQLMENFHSLLIDQNALETAGGISNTLRQAQCIAIENEQPIHAWAPFIHLGID